MKVNSLPFFALIALDSWADQDYTMSELADKLSITKQQLSHMIKVLEERGLVERIHDTANRRRVYIRICDSGREMMNQMKQEMLSSTLFGLRAYTPEELASMDECLCRLMDLMKKFNCETDEPAKKCIHMIKTPETLFSPLSFKSCIIDFCNVQQHSGLISLPFHPFIRSGVFHTSAEFSFCANGRFSMIQKEGSYILCHK